MKLTVWGCRGSIPTPINKSDFELLMKEEHKNVPFYGGNTTCFEVRAGNSVIVIDAGSGIRTLGNALAKEWGLFGKDSGKKNIVLFFTHYHHDHLQGLPFFFPAYDQRVNMHILGLSHEGHPDGMLEVVRKYLRLEQSRPFFPMPYERMASTKDHTDLVPGKSICIKDSKVVEHSTNDVDFKVMPIALYHPNDALGYIIEDNAGAQICVSADCEPLKDDCFLGCLPNQMLAKGCDLFIGDGMYTEKDYAVFSGFGHGSPESVLNQAKMVQAKAVAVTHHNPSYNDMKLFEMENEFISKAQNKG